MSAPTLEEIKTALGPAYNPEAIYAVSLTPRQMVALSQQGHRRIKALPNNVSIFEKNTTRDKPISFPQPIESFQKNDGANLKTASKGKTK